MTSIGVAKIKSSDNIGKVVRKPTLLYTIVTWCKCFGRQLYSFY